MRRVFLALVLGLFLAPLPIDAVRAQPVPALAVTTRAGVFDVQREGARWQLRLAGRPILTDEQSQSLQIAAVADYAHTDSLVVLVQHIPGGNACAGEFSLVVLPLRPGPNGFQPTVSPRFGTCSPFFSISTGQQVQVTVPPGRGGGQAARATVTEDGRVLINPPRARR